MDRELGGIRALRLYGRVSGLRGLTVRASGIAGALALGGRCRIEGRTGGGVLCEVVGFEDDQVLMLPFGGLAGIGPGSRVEILPDGPAVWPGPAWLGRVIDGLGVPLDGKGDLPPGPLPCALRQPPPPAHRRRRVGGKLDLGVTAVNTFLTCCRGQRMGIFAGSGVGKSILLSMLARFARADVIVVGLIGERGREVTEFLEDNLGAEGLARSVVVVATADQAALLRRQAAYMTLTVAEYFRDQGAEVLCLMDSVTRFAMAQREIGLAAGEPPTSKGYTPTVFSELPALLERAGPGHGSGGNITGLFTVLVEGDDHNEPVADAVRGILDGHIVLERAIAERGRFPAVNILRSVSRTLPGCNDAAQNALIAGARRLLAVHADMADMVRLGAWQAGADPELDRAIHLAPALEDFLTQDKDSPVRFAAGYDRLAAILDPPDNKPTPAPA